MPRTISVTPPTWRTQAEIAIRLLENGTNPGHDSGRGLVREMGDKLDAMVPVVEAALAMMQADGSLLLRTDLSRALREALAPFQGGR